MAGIFSRGEKMGRQLGAPAFEVGRAGTKGCRERRAELRRLQSPQAFPINTPKLPHGGREV